MLVKTKSIIILAALILFSPTLKAQDASVDFAVEKVMGTCLLNFEVLVDPISKIYTFDIGISKNGNDRTRLFFYGLNGAGLLVRRLDNSGHQLHKHLLFASSGKQLR